MDPDACLAQIRQLLAELAAEPDYDMAETARALSERVEALDGWLSKAGHLPLAWARW